MHCNVMHYPQPNQRQRRDAGFDYPVTLTPDARRQTPDARRQTPDGDTLMATFVKWDETLGQL